MLSRTPTSFGEARGFARIHQKSSFASLPKKLQRRRKKEIEREKDKETKSSRTRDVYGSVTVRFGRCVLAREVQRIRRGIHRNGSRDSVAIIVHVVFVCPDVTLRFQWSEETPI